MTDPVRDALEAAVRDAATSSYRVPEQSVRSRARCRRTLRGAVVGGLSLALLLGTGAAVLALTDELQPEPVPPATEEVDDVETDADADASPPQTEPPRGACGSTRWFVAATDALHHVVAPRDLVSVQSGAPEVEVRFRNPQSRDFDNTTGDGAVLMVVAEGRVIALSRSIDRGPTGLLASGEDHVYSEFEPLVHCVTGEPLSPGEYEFHAGRWIDDAAQENTVSDMISASGRLVVTDQIDFAPRRLASPPIARCGETLPQLARDPDVIGSTIRDFDVIEEEGPGDTGGGGLGPDNAAVTMKVVFDEAVTNIAEFMEQHFVLLRDGVVVARTGGLEDGGGWPAFEDEDDDEDETGNWPDEVKRTSVAMNFWPCDGDVNDGPLVLDGSFTLYGHLRYVTTHELGVRDEVFVEVGPHDFEHHPPVP